LGDNYYFKKKKCIFMKIYLSKMKKLLLTLGLASFMFATNAQTVLSENFDATTGTGLPVGWTQKNRDGKALNANNTLPMGTNAWISQVKSSGSTDRIMTSTSWYADTTAVSDDWLVSPQITIPSAGGYWLVFEAESPDASYLDGFLVKISTTDTAVNSFTTVLNVPAAANAYKEYAVNLAAYSGQNIYVAIINNSLNKFILHLNNFIVKKRFPYDITGLGITNAAYLAPSTNYITTKIKNSGTTSITTFTANYKINGGTVISAPVTGINIAPLTEYTYTHATPWTPTAGTYTVTTYATMLNGSNMDAVASDDISTKVISVMSKTVQRIPLLEVFTSSTCPPCKPGNAQLHSVIDPVTINKPCTIKFQQDFPGTGDPYCTTEAVNRRGYYGVNSIPRMEIDGAWDQNANSFTTALLTAAQNSPAQYELSGSYWLEGPSIHGEVTYAPAFNAPAGTKLFVAVLENKTVKNVKSNGETEFTQVMKKMLPTELGTTLPAQADGVSVTTSFDYTFKGDYRLPADGAAANRIVHAIENSVEEVEDLTMVAWLQAPDKTVFQALNLTTTPTGIRNVIANMNAVTTFPNPSNTELNIRFENTKTANTTILMMSTDGKIVYSSKKEMQAGINKVTINTAELAAGLYNVAIIDANNNSKTIQVVVAH
jgi:Secretion system C-terminal sorting domain/Cleaved Adhesin Domain